MRIAVDAMGGDEAPDAVIRGAVQALDALAPDDELLLVGREREIERCLSSLEQTDSRIRIVHADDVIAMDDKAARAVRSKPNSSIVKIARMGAGREEINADVVLSAGNTGACVSAAIMYMKRLRGVHRPGIAVTIPAFNGPVVLCDAGANPEPLASHLHQYALMAETYSKLAHGVEHPSVAMMNIGAEEGKGSDLVRATHQLLKDTPGLDYLGFIEGRDLFDGPADVVVTDGFVGNTLLKMAEGLVSSLFRAIAHELTEIDPTLAKQFQPIIRQLYARNDYHEYGGAPLLGVNGVFMIAHGSSDPGTIAAAVRNAREFVAHNINDAIRQRLDAVCPKPEPA